jgi:hypothetical protein
LLPVLSPIFMLELSHGEVIFSAGAGVKANMQTEGVPDAEPEASWHSTKASGMGVGRLLASLVEE